MSSAPRSFWPFRRRPLGDIAQAVLQLMEDEDPWRAGLLALHHSSGVVVRNTGFFLSVCAGDASLRLEGRDRAAVDRAYRRLKRRLVARAQDGRAARLRAAMALPEAEAPAAITAPPQDEPMEIVEARVRRLREAIAMRT